MKTSTIFLADDSRWRPPQCWQYKFSRRRRIWSE